MFFSHSAGTWVIGHVTYGQAVVFVASAIADFPAHPPKILSFYTTLVLGIPIDRVPTSK